MLHGKIPVIKMNINGITILIGCSFVVNLSVEVQHLILKDEISSYFVSKIK
jgi:hypothetical protein